MAPAELAATTCAAPGRTRPPGCGALLGTPPGADLERGGSAWGGFPVGAAAPRESGGGGGGGPLFGSVAATEVGVRSEPISFAQVSRMIGKSAQ